MHLRSKLILGLCLLLSGITLALWLTAKLLILPQFEASEVQYRYQDLERVTQAIRQDLDRLHGFAIDWGEWDDTYRYVQGDYPEYIASNLASIKLDKIGADLLLISGDDGRIINQFVVGPAAEKLLAGSELLERPRLSPVHPFNQVIANGGAAILDTPAGPLLLAASPVLRSSGEGHARGTLFFGKFMDTTYREKLAARTRLPLDFTLTMAGSEAPQVTFLSDSESLAYGTMALLNNPKRVLALTLHQPRPFYAQVRRMMNYAIVIILGIGSLVSMLAYGFLNIALIDPILQLKRQAEVLGTREPEQRGRALRRTDELGQLSRSFYQMASRLESSMGMLEAERQQFMAASLTDSLTRLKNRRYMEQYLETGMQATDTRGWLLMTLDLDHFKQINDVYGHDIGDLVLRQIACLLREHSRQEDILVRYGGEEFVILCRNADEQIGCALAERIRRQVARFPFGPEQASFNLTCSIGFFTLPWDATVHAASEWPYVFKVADLALYAAKHSGRNTWIGLKYTGKPPLSRYPQDSGQVKQALAEQRLRSFSSMAAEASICWPGR